MRLKTEWSVEACHSIVWKCVYVFVHVAHHSIPRHRASRIETDGCSALGFCLSLPFELQKHVGNGSVPFQFPSEDSLPPAATANFLLPEQSADALVAHGFNQRSCSSKLGMTR